MATATFAWACFFPCTDCWLASRYAAGADAGIAVAAIAGGDCVSAGCSGGAVALVVEAANSCIPSWQLHSAMPERRRDDFWRFLLVGRSSHLPCGLSWLTTGWSVHRVGDGSDQSSATLPINTHLFHHCLITLRGHISHAGSPVVGGLAYCTSSPHVHFSSAGCWHMLLLFCTHIRR